MLEILRPSKLNIAFGPGSVRGGRIAELEKAWERLFVGTQLAIPDAGLTLIVKSLVVFWIPASLTCRVKVKVPAPEGAPNILPAEGLSDNPAGSAPATTDHV